MLVIRKFFSDLLSIDESRKSIVVLILICITVFSLYKANAMTSNVDIPSNCMTIMLTLSGLVFGTNAINGVASIIQATKGNSYGSSNYGSYGSGNYNTSSYQNTTSVTTDTTINPINTTNTLDVTDAGINSGV